MSYDKKDNTGALFKNERATSDTHPQATGSATIDGVEYFVDAWTNQDRNGNRYQSLKFKRKDKQQTGKPAARQERSTSYDRDDARTHGGRDLDDDIPFIMEWR